MKQLPHSERLFLLNHIPESTAPAVLASKSIPVQVDTTTKSGWRPRRGRSWRICGRESSKRPAAFAKADRSRFLQALDAALVRLERG